jgi:hypothetical protein
VLANETPVVVNPNNNLQILSGANDYSCSSIQGFYTSNDGGSTWTRTCMGLEAGSSGDGDPGVAYDLNGTAYISGIDAQGSGSVIAFESSTDNGKTWSKPATAVTNPLGGLADKPWLQVDTRPASPFANSLYVSNTQFATNNNSEVGFSSSHDGGKTWKTIAADTEQVYPNVDQFTDLTTDNNGTIYLTWMRCSATGPSGDCGGTTASMMFATSTDGGNTFSAAKTMFTTNLAPDPGFCCFYGSLPNTSERISNIPVVAVDNSKGPHRGTLYVTYYNWTGTFMQVMVAHSTDGGNTWIRRPVSPPSINHDEFFPWVNVSPNGIVGVSWMDRRNDPSNINYEAFATFSNNGGNTFSKNFQLSAKASNPFNDGFGGFFIGDYTGNAWIANNTFLATYTDTTTGIDQDFLVGERLK